MAETNPRNCTFCNRVWGAVGITAGLILLYMGVDLMFSGGLSSMLSGGIPVPPSSTVKDDQ